MGSLPADFRIIVIQLADPFGKSREDVAAGGDVEDSQRSSLGTPEPAFVGNTERCEDAFVVTPDDGEPLPNRIFALPQPEVRIRQICRSPREARRHGDRELAVWRDGESRKLVFGVDGRTESRVGPILAVEGVDSVLVAEPGAAGDGAIGVIVVELSARGAVAGEFGAAGRFAFDPFLAIEAPELVGLDVEPGPPAGLQQGERGGTELGGGREKLSIEGSAELFF